MRFLDYTSPATGEWMPRTIEVWRGNERALMALAEHPSVEIRLYNPFRVRTWGTLGAAVDFREETADALEALWPGESLVPQLAHGPR